jgi:hypothetical protein
MTIQPVSNFMLYGVSGDTKPTVYANNTLFVEQDTGNIYRWNLGTTTWVLFIGATKTETLTNKTIAAGSNTISGIADANIASHTSTKITITAKSQLNGSIPYTDQTNTWGAFDQIYPSSRLLIGNPAATFNYTIAGSAIAAARTLTLPLLTGNDQVTTDAFATTLTNKTIVAANNTISDTSIATGDILRSNGTKFVRLARGSANQVLATNSGATDIAWTTISSYTEGKGSSSKNGDASTTTFTIAHGLAGTPTYISVVPNAADADSEYYLTVDATNITINYSFPPPTGTGNLLYFWRAAL